MGEHMKIRLIKQKDVAEMLGMTESWVEQIRLRGGGPVYHKVGKNVRYMVEDVEAWLKTQRKYSTSQSA